MKHKRQLLQDLALFGAMLALSIATKITRVLAMAHGLVRRDVFAVEDKKTSEVTEPFLWWGFDWQQRWLGQFVVSLLAVVSASLDHRNRWHTHTNL